MSEEEIIKTINNFLNAIKTFGTIDYKCIPNLYEPIQGLLDLYNKEKEKNTLLEQEREYLNCIIESDEDNYISKDKIRDKISQYKAIRNEMLKIENEIGRASITYDIVRNDYCEKMLQSLLEESE